MIDLTNDEVHLLRDLYTQRGLAMISGNKSHKGLDRLVDVGHVECRHVAPDANIYELMPAGAEALRTALNMPAPQAGTWPDKFRCDCPRGTQIWNDEQGHSRCAHCNIEYSLNPTQTSLQQVTSSGEVRRLISHDNAWIRTGLDGGGPAAQPGQKV